MHTRSVDPMKLLLTGEELGIVHTRIYYHKTRVTFELYEYRCNYPRPSMHSTGHSFRSTSSMVHCGKTKRTRLGPRSPKSQEMSQDVPLFSSCRIQVEADERVAQLERQLAQKEIAFAALEQESLPK